MLESAIVKILLVEDNPGDARLTRELLSEAEAFRFELHHVERLADAAKALRESPCDAVLLDLSLPDSHGVAGITDLQRVAPNVPIVVLTGRSDTGLALEVLKAGAEDYLTKGLGDGNLMARAIRYSIERARVRLLLIDAKARAEVASRVKTEFLANMSHELRTPLNAIMGFSELLKSEMLGPLGNSSYREYASDIHQSASHLLEIINDILDISKVEAGKVELDVRQVNVADVIASALRLIGERASNAGLRVLTEIEPDLPSLSADPRLLKQILINLLSNAVKFTPGGGTVTVRAGLEPAGELFIAVADTGIGIAEENMAHVMQPFGQVDAAINRKYEGTGLGLPLVKSFAQLHGGTFELTSQVEVGTTGTVRFPSSRVMVKSPQAAA